MQLVRLQMKAQTPRLSPLRSPGKTSPTSIEYSHYIFLGPVDNIKIVKFTKNVTSLSAKLIRSQSPNKDQNLSTVVEIVDSKPKHQKTSSVQIKNFSPGRLLKNHLSKNINESFTKKVSTIHHYHHRSEMTLETCSDQSATPTITVQQLKFVEQTGNVSSKGVLNSTTQRAQIMFSNGLFYEGDIRRKQDSIKIEGFGILYTDQSKWSIVYEGRWKSNSFHGKGKYYNQYQIESSKDWHFNWKMIQAIFNKGEIIEGKIEFFLTDKMILQHIDYQK